MKWASINLNLTLKHAESEKSILKIKLKSNSTQICKISFHLNFEIKIDFLKFFQI